MSFFRAPAPWWPSQEQRNTFKEGDYVDALYENELYLGKVIDTDVDDELCLTVASFSRRHNINGSDDQIIIKIWMSKDDIKFDITELIPSGKLKRLLKIPPEDRRKLGNCNI